jgi:addiction module HigA family antidote
MTWRLLIITEDNMMTWQEVHPGAILREELEARGLSASALALKLRVAPQRIQEIVAGKRGISPETALRLGRYFGNEPEFWLSLQATHDLAVLRREQGDRINAEVEATV